MIISVALLGFAAAGTLLTFIKEWALRNFNLVIPTLMISCGLLMGLVMVLAQSQQIQFDSYLIFSDKQQQLRLFISYILYFIPFFTGALAIGLIFIKRVEHIGKFYFANLLGSGAGGILALGMISSFMPATLSALAGMLPVVAGIFITTSRFSITRIYAILSLLILVFLFLYPPKLSLSQFKSLSKTLNLPDAEILWEKTSHHGLIQLVSAPALRFAPGISLAYTDPIPVVRGVFNNGNWFGPLLFGNQLDSLMLMRYTTNNLPYIISSPRKVLILNAGTGLEIDHALKNGPSMRLSSCNNSNSPACSSRYMSPGRANGSGSSGSTLSVTPLCSGPR